MKQYNAIKMKYPDAMLLFRVGDFYETFGQDAVKASKILGIVLTKRGAGSEGGWDRYSSTGKKLGKCGDGKDGAAYAACLSKEKANKLGPKGRATFVNKKRADQKKAGDSKKGGNSTKGKTPTFSKTGA